MNNVVYLDNDTNEIVTKKVAFSRLREGLYPEDILDYMRRNMDWEDIAKYIDPDFVGEVSNEIVEECFPDRFTEYEIIESE